MTKLQMEAIVPMSMVNFDENQIIANGAKIYDQRAKIESIADSIVDNGFDLLLFTSSRRFSGDAGIRSPSISATCPACRSKMSCPPT